MDISTLPLPLRKDKPNIFTAKPSISNVNVTYDTLDTDTQTPFPTKQAQISPSASLNSISSSSPKQRQRSHSSFSLASSECQNFVASLKEPKYSKPLSSNEISDIFQDFYLKLKSELLGNENELLTASEKEELEYIKQNIDSILDKAEKAVTCGELHAKLFALDASYDAQLQPRIDLIRSNLALAQKFELTLDLPTIKVNEPVEYLNKINKELSPKGKLALLVKAHKSLASESMSNDDVLPLFCVSLMRSTASNWYQNLTYIKRFRRASELTGQSAYCLTNLEAAIAIVNDFVDVDYELISKPLRLRSNSNSSRKSSSSIGQRLGDTLNSYRTMLVKKQHPLVDQRFLSMDADQLTIGDVRVLLKEYKRLAEELNGTIRK